MKARERAVNPQIKNLWKKSCRQSDNPRKNSSPDFRIFSGSEIQRKKKLADSREERSAIQLSII